jgi:hypothetical protein
MGINFWRFWEESCDGVGDDSQSQDLFFNKVVIQRLMPRARPGRSDFVEKHELGLNSTS